MTVSLLCLTTAVRPWADPDGCACWLVLTFQPLQTRSIPDQRGLSRWRHAVVQDQKDRSIQQGLRECTLPSDLWKTRALETRRIVKPVEDSGALGNRVAAPRCLPCLNIGGCTTGRSEINGRIGLGRESYGGWSGINGSFLFTAAPDSPAPLSGASDPHGEIMVGFLP